MYNIHCWAFSRRVVSTSHAIGSSCDGTLGHVSRQVENTSHIRTSNLNVQIKKWDSLLCFLIMIYVSYFISYDSLKSANDIDGEVEEPPNPDRCLKVKKIFKY